MMGWYGGAGWGGWLIVGGGAGEGAGIAAGSAGWVTLDVRLGRYELVCNLPGHHRAGVASELDVG